MSVTFDIENMYIWIIAVIVIMITVAGLLSHKIIRDNKRRKDYPYEFKMLLTKTEYGFFKRLQEIADEKEYMICPKVRLEDFVYVTNREELLKYRGYIKSRHVDFLICDRDVHVICGIELDDKSHDRVEAQKIDKFKDELFDTIGIPLYRIKVGDNYTKRIREILG